MLLNKILITGGAGFIGSAVIRYLMQHTDSQIVNIDKLTYAANLNSIGSIKNSKRYYFEKLDLCDLESLRKVFLVHKPEAVMHLAAESHVDRSIKDSGVFMQTNIIGTYNLLRMSHEFRVERFLHVSTDEVYGDLKKSDPPFTESTPYCPSSPYSASKAASDHLVRAWNRTYGLPSLISNCSNNYGPWQFPEKLIPLTILNALRGRPLPVYGDGSQIRDWLFVDDHARALLLVLKEGVIGETYNIGGHNERRNLEVVRSICKILEDFGVENSADLIHFVTERPGHDQRYAIDSTKIQKELGWKPKETFETGLRKTISWYVDMWKTKRELENVCAV